MSAGNLGQTPLVSAIIPTYNGERFIREAIDSALNQTLARVEVVVVDDGSNDGTPAILSSYGSRIKVVRQRNGGVAAARNAGIEAANGRWIGLLDHDDIWDPDKLERQLLFLDRNPNCVLVYSRARLRGALPGREGVDGALTGWPGEPEYGMHDSLMIKNRIPALTTVFLRSLALELGGFRQEIAPADDWDMWMRMARGREVGFIPDPLATFRLHGTNFHHRNVERMLGAAEVIFEPRLGCVEHPELRDKVRLRHYCWIASMWAANGFEANAMAMLRRAWGVKTLDRDLLTATARVGKAVFSSRRRGRHKIPVVA